MSLETMFSCEFQPLSPAASLVVWLPQTYPLGGLTEGLLGTYEAVLFYITVFHSIDERIGCLPLDEVLGQSDKGPVGIPLAIRRSVVSWF
jgi:hypothetical protein